MNNYFESLKQNYRNDYLTSTPRKREVIDNAQRGGRVFILPNSNNRAIVIEDADKTYLQSYDTLILVTDKETQETIKLWGGYSFTTMKHINEYLRSISRNALNKKEWESIAVGNNV